ncbi:multicopper oxidase family protein [Nocardia sp. NPDC058379]|uniref:multicopper oxidase family protein n=1 Tax=Nocardia sp. NPDC058379 TaxID=3346470 RepID=UPI00364ABCA8
MAPVYSDATTDHYEIIQRTAQLDILPSLRTEAWTYHGTFPGPTIRARSGRATSVRHRNELPHPTVVHLHGGHTPADSDGYPMDLILPIGTTTTPQRSHGHGTTGTTAAPAYGERTYLYPNRQRAASLWYHDHRHSFTGPAVWRGLAGFHLIGDDIEDALPLPRGDRDIPLLISDRSFAVDGSFASEACSTGRSATATSTSPPAERFDVIIDFSAYSPGTSVRLRNILDTGPAADIMRFDVTGSLRRDDTTVPDQLAPLERLDPAAAVAERTFLFQLGPAGWSINGAPYQPGRALAQPRLGAVEIWRFITDFHHPVHVHLDPFQVVSRNNRPPGPFDRGWKDTVDVRPAEAVEVAVRFTDYPGPFMLHCHNLEHEDMAMMADFTVT